MKKIITILALCLCLTGCLPLLSGCNPISGGIRKDGTVVVGATSVPHAEILEFAKSILLRDYDIKLEVQRVDSYALLNPATSSGDTYANYFQHGFYLAEYNGTVASDKKLVSIGAIQAEPLGIYLGGKSSGQTLAAIIANKSALKIALTNDATNQSRALKLLEANGLITLKSGSASKTTLTVQDFEWGSHSYVEVSAELLASGLPDVDLAVIPGNYALLANLKQALVTETSDVWAAYANVVVVKTGNENSTISQALYAVLTGTEVQNFIRTTYGDAVVTAASLS